MNSFVLSTTRSRLSVFKVSKFLLESLVGDFSHDLPNESMIKANGS